MLGSFVRDSFYNSEALGLFGVWKAGGVKCCEYLVRIYIGRKLIHAAAWIILWLTGI